MVQSTGQAVNAHLTEVEILLLVEVTEVVTTTVVWWMTLLFGTKPSQPSKLQQLLVVKAQSIFSHSMKTVTASLTSLKSHLLEIQLI